MMRKGEAAGGGLQDRSTCNGPIFVAHQHCKIVLRDLEMYRTSNITHPIPFHLYPIL